MEEIADAHTAISSLALWAYDKCERYVYRM